MKIWGGIGRGIGDPWVIESGVCQGTASSPDISSSSSDLPTASPLTAYAGEASSPSIPYATACSKVIARPSARTSSKVASPNCERAAALT